MAKKRRTNERRAVAEKTTSDQKRWRPFHETIVEMIGRVGSLSSEMLCLLELIRITKIPAGHDEIIAAIEEREEGMKLCSRFVLDWVRDSLRSLREQKRLAEEKTTREKQVGEELEDMMR